MTATSREQGLVAEFHRTMGIPSEKEPTMLTAERGERRCQLIQEEAGEFSEANETGDWLEMVDALVDLLYVTYGAAVEMGVDLAPFFDEVHRANMRKEAGADGGKSVKPKGWTAPDLAHIFNSVYANTPLPTRR